MSKETIMKVDRRERNEIHIRKHPDDATAKPVWCGKVGKASITEAWGFYGPGGFGHDDVCRDCIDEERRSHGVIK